MLIIWKEASWNILPTQQYSGICKDTCANKRYRKLKGQSRMEKPEKLATLGTQYTGRRQTTQKIQHKKLNRWAIWTTIKNQGWTQVLANVVSVSYELSRVKEDPVVLSTIRLFCFNLLLYTMKRMNIKCSTNIDDCSPSLRWWFYYLYICIFYFTI